MDFAFRMTIGENRATVAGAQARPPGVSFLMPAHQTVLAVVKLSEGWLLVDEGSFRGCFLPSRRTSWS